MPPPFAMSGEEVLKAVVSPKNSPHGAAGGFPLYTKFTNVACLPVLKRPPGLSRAYLRGASFGTRLVGGKHGPFIVLVMARVR